jgi:ferredoxin
MLSLAQWCRALFYPHNWLIIIYISMAHNTTISGYSRLADRLNRFPQGAPVSELLFKILKMLFSEKDAELVSTLPIKPFTAEKACQVWKMDLASTRKVLDALADRAILVDIEQDGRTFYVLPPPMAGFFEFSMMRVRNDIDQKALSELFYQYLNQEEDFVRELFTHGETQLGRTFVHEPALSMENVFFVLDYERSTEVIKTASHRAVSMCYCRHKMNHLEKACGAPLDICMTFNGTAASLIKHGIARKVDSAECLDLLQSAYEHGLVQFGENVRENVNFICNCCKCCCEAMIAARRFAMLNPVHTTNFIPEIDEKHCTGCGRCVEVCPVDAVVLAPSGNPAMRNSGRASLNEDLCLGCGLCVRSCKKAAIHLKSRPKRVITPLNGAHRSVVMAIERGKLHHLIFDNQVLWSHRAMACVLGVILKLPPVKQVLASRQMKSRYLEALIKLIQC